MTLEREVPSVEQDLVGATQMDHLGPAPLHISVSWMDGHPLVVLVGELDLSTSPLLRERLAELTTADTTEITLDIGLVTFIDSTALSVLLMQHKRMASQGGRMVLFSPTASTRRLLEVSGLTSTFCTVP